MQAASFKNHVRNAQILLTGLVAAISFLWTTNRLQFDDQSKYIWMGFAIFLTTVTFYFVHDTLEANFAVQALSERIATIEDQINRLLDTKVLIWESVVAKKFWTPLRPAKGILHPIPIMMFYEVLMIIMIIGFTLFVYVRIWMLPTSGTCLKIGLALSALYSAGSLLLSIYVWRGINRTLRKEVRKLIDSV
jgi:hypothetical protein